jgi:hypothetical protein
MAYRETAIKLSAINLTGQAPEETTATTRDAVRAGLLIGLWD